MSGSVMAHIAEQLNRKRLERDRTDALLSASRTRLPPIQFAIRNLKAECGNTLPYRYDKPEELQHAIDVSGKPFDLRMIKESFLSLRYIGDRELLLHLVSNGVLPLLKMWKVNCVDDMALAEKLRAALPISAAPWADDAAFISNMATKYIRIIECTTENLPETCQHPHLEVMLSLSRFAHQYVRANETQFLDRAHNPELSDSKLHLLGARIFLSAYLDLMRYPNGFLATLLDSPLTDPRTSDSRKEWDRLLRLPDIVVGSGTDEADAAATYQQHGQVISEPGESDVLEPDEYDVELDDRFRQLYAEWRIETDALDAQGPDPSLPVYSAAGLSTMFGRRKSSGEVKKEKVYVPAKHAVVVPDQDRMGRGPWRANKCNNGWQTNDLGHPEDDSTTLYGDYKNAREYFTATEELTYLSRFAVVENLHDADELEGGFEWIRVAEVLPGRSTADCVRWYYDNKSRTLSNWTKYYEITRGKLGSNKRPIYATSYTEPDSNPPQGPSLDDFEQLGVKVRLQAAENLLHGAQRERNLAVRQRQEALATAVNLPADDSHVQELRAALESSKAHTATLEHEIEDARVKVNENEKERLAAIEQTEAMSADLEKCEKQRHAAIERVESMSADLEKCEKERHAAIERAVTMVADLEKCEKTRQETEDLCHQLKDLKSKLRQSIARNVAKSSDAKFKKQVFEDKYGQQQTTEQKAAAELDRTIAISNDNINDNLKAQNEALELELGIGRGEKYPNITDLASAAAASPIDMLPTPTTNQSVSASPPGTSLETGKDGVIAALEGDLLDSAAHDEPEQISDPNRCVFDPTKPPYNSRPTREPDWQVVYRVLGYFPEPITKSKP